MKLFVWSSFGLSCNLHMNDHKQAILYGSGKWASQLCCWKARSVVRKKSVAGTDPKPAF